MPHHARHSAAKFAAATAGVYAAGYLPYAMIDEAGRVQVTPTTFGAD